MLPQACVSWPIGAGWVFGRGDRSVSDRGGTHNHNLSTWIGGCHSALLLVLPGVHLRYCDQKFPKFPKKALPGHLEVSARSLMTVSTWNFFILSGFIVVWAWSHSENFFWKHILKRVCDKHLLKLYVIKPCIRSRDHINIKTVSSVAWHIYIRRPALKLQSYSHTILPVVAESGFHMLPRTGRCQTGRSLFIFVSLNIIRASVLSVGDGTPVIDHNYLHITAPLKLFRARWK